MKMPLTSVATLLAAAMFQTAAQAPVKPPMRMGLWETNGTSKIRQVDGSDKSVSSLVRSCVTQENWLKLMGPTAQGACPKTNEVWSKDGYSFDVACQGKPRTASVSVHFDSPEADHGSLDVYLTPDGQPTKLHQEFEGHWVSSECGDVSPNHPVLVR